MRNLLLQLLSELRGDGVPDTTFHQIARFATAEPPELRAPLLRLVSEGQGEGIDGGTLAIIRDQWGI
jgi:hypothetical protein